MTKKKNIKKRFIYNGTYSDKSNYGEYVEYNKQYFDKNRSDVAEKFKKEQISKPKKLAKWIVNTLVICSILVFVIALSTVAVVLTGTKAPSYVEFGEQNVHNFVALEIMPDETGTDLNDVVSSLSSDALIAEQIYNICARNVKNAPYFTSYNNGSLFMQIGTSDNYIDIDSVVMKSQKEYFSIIYHLNNSIPILDSVIGSIISKTTDVITTERMYAKAGDKHMLYQKVRNNSRDVNGVPLAKWSPIIDIENDTSKKSVPVFNSSQSGQYDITKHVVNVNTIDSVSVEYNGEEKYYTVKLVLNHNLPETVKNSLEDIRVGTGDKNARYTKIAIEFTAWDNGYFRSFALEEHWSANVVISLNFNLKTNWLCSYNPADCNFDKYPDAKHTKSDFGIR